MHDLLNKIKTQVPNMTAKQLRIAKCLEENINSLSFMNASQLAKKAEVSEASVTRFARLLGYESVARLLADMQTGIRDRASLTMERYSNIPAHSSVMAEVFALEKSIMDDTLDQVSPELFAECVDMLFTAKDVLVVSSPPSDCLCLYASHFLGLHRKRVHELRTFDAHSINIIQDLDPKFVTLAFGFPRYPSGTQQILDVVSRKSRRVIAVTDSLLSPLIPYAEKVLLTPQRFLSNLDPFAAVVALIHSLILGVYLKDQTAARERLLQYDALIKEPKLFDHQDVEIANLMRR